jgi:hypothetical protein
MDWAMLSASEWSKGGWPRREGSRRSLVVCRRDWSREGALGCRGRRLLSCKHLTIPKPEYTRLKKA